ncbi:MAG: hypothetical protein CMH48_03235 [Muricauda sp.]|nr:amidohydrolase family protein [Allomuricauda sp.]MBC29836.1 hypothetical protein [Allomuricauda sp.]|tara:strand:- start:413 stop:1837 length:1425 start_codon:yes stop_codon:yes gene_type:complete
MRKIISLICVSSIFFSITSCKEDAITGEVIITNVNVIDVVSGTNNSSQTIAIESGKINSITSFSETVKLNSETIIDGKGKYVIPALWDMHTHYTTSKVHRNFLSLFVANGVLGVRDLWGSLESRDSLMNSDAIAPKIYLSGAIIDGPFTLLQGTLQPKSTEDAINMVDSLHQKGADFIKVYDDLSEDIYNAIANKCNELKLPFLGHVPMAIKTEDASKKGQKSMEHLNGIWQSCTSKEKEIDSLQLVFKNNFMTGNIPGAMMAFTTINTFYNNFYDEKEAKELAKVLGENNTYVTPTLIVTSNHWRRKDGRFKKLSVNKYIPDNMLNQWDPELNFPEKMFPQTTWEVGKQLLSTSMKITKMLHSNGVPILAGTDCGVSYVIPGFSLHDELKLMVEAGLSEVEALQTATINPAKYFGISQSSGQISTGMKANILLLDGNPLEDISNTKKIYGVIRNGNYLNRTYLDNLLKEAEIK